MSLSRRLLSLRSLLVGIVGCALVGAAQADEHAELEQLRATTQALIQALMDQGLITPARAQALLKQAAPRPVDVAAAPSPSAAASDVRPGTVRVPYIPDTLKAQIKEDIKLDVLATARAEGWANPKTLPAWLGVFTFEGDLRVRGEFDRLPGSNTPAALYRSQVESPAWSPDLANTQTDRSRLTLRARFGVHADISEQLTAGLRLSTGTIPASASQTLGSGAGHFNRYSFGLDRAWLHYEPVAGYWIQGGRMATPFYGTDLLWPDDLSVDGVAAHAQHGIGGGAIAYATVGAFALQELELSTADKWLVGAQVGADWPITGKTNFRVGAAVYDFRNVAGVRETNPAPTGPLAGTVPYQLTAYPVGARQRGNTLINLNDPTSTAAPVWGLASKFRPINLTAALAFDQLDAARATVTLDYVKNSAFDLADIQRRAGSASVADLADKTTGLQARFQIGSKTPGERGAWDGFFALRRFDRDAWVDALTDTTWNLGGTSYQGYSVGGSYAFDRKSTIGLRWTSTRSLDDGRRFLANPNDPTSVTGNLSSAPLVIDVIQARSELAVLTMRGPSNTKITTNTKRTTHAVRRLTAACAATCLLLATGATHADDDPNRTAHLREALRRAQAALQQAQADVQTQRAACERDKSELGGERARFAESTRRADSQLAGARSQAAESRSQLAATTGMLAEQRSQAASAASAASAQRERGDALDRRIAAATRQQAEQAQTIAALRELLETATQNLARTEFTNRDLYAYGLQLIDRVRGRTVADQALQADPVLGLASVRLENNAEALRDRLEALRLPNRTK